MTCNHWTKYPAIQPDANYVINYLPAFAYTNPISCITTKFVHVSTNKVRCPINAIKFFCYLLTFSEYISLKQQWTPEGRRLITGASSGEFTLWNGMNDKVNSY